MKDKKSTFASFFKAKNTKAGALSIAITVFVIAAVIMLNIVAGILSSRYSLYADMTANDAYELQDSTSAFTASVDKDTEIFILANETVFEGYGDYYVQANRLIRRIAESSEKITLSYVDLTTDPTWYNITYNKQNNSSNKYIRPDGEAANTAANGEEGGSGGGDKANYFGVDYEEGIYLGYKYYETRYEDCILNRGGASSSVGAFDSKAGWNYAEEVSYPFGYGISYTTFEQALTSVVKNADNTFTIAYDYNAENSGIVSMTGAWERVSFPHR